MAPAAAASVSILESQNAQELLAGDEEYLPDGDDLCDDEDEDEAELEEYEEGELEEEEEVAPTPIATRRVKRLTGHPIQPQANKIIPVPVVIPALVEKRVVKKKKAPISPAIVPEEVFKKPAVPKIKIKIAVAAPPKIKKATTGIPMKKRKVQEPVVEVVPQIEQEEEEEKSAYIPPTIIAATTAVRDVSRAVNNFDKTRCYLGDRYYIQVAKVNHAGTRAFNYEAMVFTRDPPKEEENSGKPPKKPFQYNIPSRLLPSLFEALYGMMKSAGLPTVL